MRGFELHINWCGQLHVWFYSVVTRLAVVGDRAADLLKRFPCHRAPAAVVVGRFAVVAAAAAKESRGGALLGGRDKSRSR